MLRNLKFCYGVVSDCHPEAAFGSTSQRSPGTLFGGQLLVNVDTEAGLIVGVHIAVAHFGQTREHLVDVLGKLDRYLIRYFRLQLIIQVCPAVRQHSLGAGYRDR